MNTLARAFMRTEVPVAAGKGRTDLWHMHLDIRGNEPLSKKEVAVLRGLQAQIRTLRFVIEDQPFCRLDKGQIAAALDLRNDELASLLGDPEHYSAPLAHWTCMSRHAAFSPEAARFFAACGMMANAVDSLGHSAYLECEQVQQVWIKPEQAPSISPSGAYAPFPVPSFWPHLVDLKELGREFRDSEVHITIDRAKEADPRVFMDLFRTVGFHIAHRPLERGDMSIVATVQGFEPDMLRVFLAALDWAKRCHEEGSVRCDIGIKHEEIAWHYVARNPWLLPVVRPGALSPA